MAQVVLENLYKTFPRREAPGEAQRDRADALEDRTSAIAGGEAAAVLRRINLTANDGELLVLVGPSGCGKSTLLRVVAGLETPTGGTVRIGDRPVNALPPKARNIAMVFQSYALYPHMSVYDNLAFGLRRMPGAWEEPGRAAAGRDAGERGPWQQRWARWRQSGDRALVEATRRLPKPLRYVSPQEVRVEERVWQVARMLQLDPLLERYPKQLSGGQKQRVALGRAIARQPAAFLMDEPLSNLDAKLRAETRTQIVALQRQLGITTLYVTHDQVEAMTMGDRIAVMNGGRIQQVAPPLEIYRHPANRFVAEFIGSPPMNFLPVQLKGPLLLVNGEFRMTLPEIWTDTLAPYDGRSLLLGIRPEHWLPSVPAPKNLRVRVAWLEALGRETYAGVVPSEPAIAASVAAERSRSAASESRGGALPPTLDLTAVAIAGQGRAAEGSLQVCVAADYPVQAGSELWLSIPQDRLHLFDPKTGDALRP